MKNYSPLLILAGIFFIAFFSCKKINESTELGDGLIPPVDNVTTFDTSLTAITINKLFNDSIRMTNSDYVAAGDLNDAGEFGKVHANFQFGIAPSTQPGSYPYYHKDSLKVDSVVLTLGYVDKSAYGDVDAGSLTFRVFEIAQNSGFKYDSSYRYNDASTEFSITGPQLGSKTFQVSKLKDSIDYRRGSDTIRKFANAVRIVLDSNFGRRLMNYDTTSGNNGGYKSDSVFRTLFKGFAIKVDQSGNVLTYFDLANAAKTKLTVYYQVDHLNGKDDTLSYDYTQTVLRSGFPSPQGKTNWVNVTQGGNWASAISSGATDKIYVQGAPSGSYTSIVIPALSTMQNKVIHRAELIATQIPSTMDNIFTPPGRLYLDRFRSGSKDTSLVFEKDILVASDGSVSLNTFGGGFKNKSYIFNITRYVQGIVTRHERNDSLRLYSPFETQSYIPGLGVVPVQLSNVIYTGRAVLAGGSYPDPKTRLRLRIIYSNL